MHELVVNKNKTLVEGVKFIPHSYDEMTTCDSTIMGFHSCLCC
jgi:hypothetical protein